MYYTPLTLLGVFTILLSSSGARVISLNDISTGDVVIGVKAGLGEDLGGLQGHKSLNSIEALNMEAILEYESIMSSIESSEEEELIDLYSILEGEVLELASFTPISEQERLLPSSSEHNSPPSYHLHRQDHNDAVRLPEFLVKFLNFFKTTGTSNQSNQLFPYLRTNPFSPPRRGPLLLTTTTTTPSTEARITHPHRHHSNQHHRGGGKKLRCKLRRISKFLKNQRGLKWITFLCGVGFLSVISIRLINRNLSIRKRKNVGVISLTVEENEKVFV